LVLKSCWFAARRTTGDRRSDQAAFKLFDRCSRGCGWSGRRSQGEADDRRLSISTDLDGHEQARRHTSTALLRRGAGGAEDYIAGLKAQSIAGRDYTLADVAAAFEESVVVALINQLAQASISARIVLVWSAGQRQTSIAERMSKVLGEHL